MNTEQVYTEEETLKADTILEIEKDILLSIIKNLNSYVETAENIDDNEIIPIITSSIIMAVTRLEEAFKFDVGRMVVELINNQKKQKLN